jgi:hypothetical protein
MFEYVTEFPHAVDLNRDVSSEEYEIMKTWMQDNECSGHWCRIGYGEDDRPIALFRFRDENTAFWFKMRFK